VKGLDFAMIGYGSMGKSHSYALLATGFFFRRVLEAVTRSIADDRWVAIQ
jgi:ketol-acid reductoisomerase